MFGFGKETLLKLLVVVLMVDFGRKHVFGNHFRGGTISWRATGNGNEVHVIFYGSFLSLFWSLYNLYFLISKNLLS